MPITGPSTITVPDPFVYNGAANRPRDEFRFPGALGRDLSGDKIEEYLGGVWGPAQLPMVGAPRPYTPEWDGTSASPTIECSYAVRCGNLVEVWVRYIPGGITVEPISGVRWIGLPFGVERSGVGGARDGQPFGVAFDSTNQYQMTAAYYFNTGSISDTYLQRWRRFTAIYQGAYVSGGGTPSNIRFAHLMYRADFTNPAPGVTL